MDKAIKISNWIFNYAQNAKVDSLICGVSGGVDSALVSTLCAMTGMNTYCLVMPIHQRKIETDLGETHIHWLQDKYPNVHLYHYNLTDLYDLFCDLFPHTHTSELGFANSKARLRMTTLYQVAAATNGLVVGTGNACEDFGIGFATKHGDLACDISPIGNLYKSEVYAMAKELGVIEEILRSKPTDGLWADGRADEDQIGCTYDELEEVMEGTSTNQKAIEIYNYFHNKNLHKMNPIPVCKM